MRAQPPDSLCLELRTSVCLDEGPHEVSILPGGHPLLRFFNPTTYSFSGLLAASHPLSSKCCSGPDPGDLSLCTSSAPSLSTPLLLITPRFISPAQAFPQESLITQHPPPPRLLVAALRHLKGILSRSTRLSLSNSLILPNVHDKNLVVFYPLSHIPYSTCQQNLRGLSSKYEENLPISPPLL